MPSPNAQMKQLLDPGGRAHLPCSKCRTAVILPPHHDTQLEADFAALVRRDAVEGARFAEAAFGFGPREAKILALHITREPGKCHRCGKSLSARNTVCTRRSANLDW